MNTQEEAMSNQTEPVFDANGWCSNMTLAPMAGEEILLVAECIQYIGWYETYEGWTTGEVRLFPTHWKPLGPGPVGT